MRFVYKPLYDEALTSTGDMWRKWHYGKVAELISDHGDTAWVVFPECTCADCDTMRNVLVSNHYLEPLVVDSEETV